MRSALVVLLGVFLAVGCSSKYDTEGWGSIKDSALEKHGLIGAPSWVGGQSSEQDRLSAAGSAKITKAGLQFAKNEALAEARDALARQIGTNAKGALKKATNVSSGGYDNEVAVEKIVDQAINQTVSQLLVGSRQKDTWISNDGSEIHVLVGIDGEFADKVKKNMLRKLSEDSGLSAKDKKQLSSDFGKSLDEAFKSPVSASE